jgi:hypothetical protein
MSYVETAHFYIAGKSYTADPTASGFDFSQTTSSGSFAQTLSGVSGTFVGGNKVEVTLTATIEGPSADIPTIVLPPMEFTLGGTIQGLQSSQTVSFYPKKESYIDLFYFTIQPYTADATTSDFDYSQTINVGNTAQTLEGISATAIAGLPLESDFTATLTGPISGLTAAVRPPVEFTLDATIAGVNGAAAAEFKPSIESYRDTFSFSLPASYYEADATTSDFYYGGLQVQIDGVIDTLSASVSAASNLEGQFTATLNGVTGNYSGEIPPALDIVGVISGLESGGIEGWQPIYPDVNFITSAVYYLSSGEPLDPVTFDFTPTLNQGTSFTSELGAGFGASFVAGNPQDAELQGSIDGLASYFIGQNERYFDLNFITSAAYELESGSAQDPVLFEILKTENLASFNTSVGLGQSEFIAGNPIEITITGGPALGVAVFDALNPNRLDINGTILGVEGSFVAGQTQFADISATISGLEQANIEGFTSIWSNISAEVGFTDGYLLAANAPQGTVSATIEGLGAYFSVVNPVEGTFDSTLGPLGALFEASAPIEINFAATLGPVELEADGNYVENDGVFEPATLDDLVGGAIAKYDSNMNRFIRYGAPESTQKDGTLTYSEPKVVRTDATINNFEYLSNQVDATKFDGALVCFPKDNATPLDSSLLNITVTSATFIDDGQVCAVVEPTIKTYPDVIEVPSVAATTIWFDKVCTDIVQLTPLYDFKLRVNLENTGDYQIDSITQVALPEDVSWRYTPTTTFEISSTDFAYSNVSFESIFIPINPYIQDASNVNFGSFTTDTDYMVSLFLTQYDEVFRPTFTYNFDEAEPGYIPNSKLTTFFDFELGVDSPDFTFVDIFGIQYEYYYHSHTVGVVSNDFNSLRQAAAKFELKRCGIVEAARRPPTGQTPFVDDPRPDPDPDPPSGVTITVPEQEVYTVLNDILVTLADDITEIELDDIQLSLDADSTSWSFSATLADPSQINLIRPDSNGNAVELHITINTYSWHVLVEKPVTTRTFDGRQIRLSGRGKTALLGKPYVQSISGTQGSLLSVQQLAELYIPNGWTLNWESPVWNIDAGAFSFNNLTNIEVLSRIAKDIGASLVPARDLQSLTMRPRYPVLPWNFSGTNVDVAIPDSAIYQITEEPTSAFYANGVYVHGSEIGGEIGFCRLTGTTGDKRLATVSNSLMTDVIGLRALGERLLAGEYQQPTIQSFTTFMDGTTVPLINIGDFVGITVDGAETKGIVNAVTISVAATDVTQSIRIGENTENTWQAFNALLPKDPLLLGQLASTDGSTSVMSLLDGGVIRVRGTGNVNANYYIQSGQIQGDAPNLPSFEIVI